MDTLSSSVSTLKVPTFHSSSSSSRELTHFKSNSTPYTQNLPQNPHLFSTSKPICNSSISTKPSSAFTPIFPASSLRSSPAPEFHRKPAAGYAAALLDAAQRDGSVDQVGNDVARFSKLLRNKRVRAVMADPFLGEAEKGRLVREAAEKGRFDRYLVCLVKMLVGKNKVGVVEQVLEDFERIYDEVSGTRVVLISSFEKMEEHQLSGIARRVQMLTGAVKVKVRNLVRDQESLSFAV